MLEERVILKYLLSSKVDALHPVFHVDNIADGKQTDL